MISNRKTNALGQFSQRPPKSFRSEPPKPGTSPRHMVHFFSKILLTHNVTKDPLDRFSALFDCYIGDNSDNSYTKRESSVILPITSEITTLSGIGVGLGVNLRCHSRMACLDTRVDVPLSDTCAVRMKACKSSKFCLPQEHETNNPLVCPAEPVKHLRHPTHQKACLQIVGQVFMSSCHGSFFRWQTFDQNDFQFTELAYIYTYNWALW